MKAIGVWLNEAYYEELEKIKDLGLDVSPQEPKYLEQGYVYFDIEKVNFFNMNGEGYIRVNLMQDTDLIIKYEEEVWSCLLERYSK